MTDGIDLDLLVPPSNLAAEAAVLGSILLDPVTALVAARLVRPDQFYKQGNARIFEAATSLATAGTIPDAVSIPAELKRREQFDQIGGESYLISLLDGIPSAANIAHYAKLVADAAALRGLIAVARSIERLAYTPGAVVEEVFSAAEQRLLEIVQRKVGDDGPRRLSQVLLEVVARLERREVCPGIPSGYGWLDTLTGGFRRGELTIIAARPSIGKSSFLLGVLRQVAMTGTAVGLFSLEMPARTVAENMLGQYAEFPAFRISMCALGQGDIETLTWRARELSEAKILIDDKAGERVSSIRAKARLMKIEHGIGLVGLDYVQLVQGPKEWRKGESREQEVAAVSRTLKQIARELDVPVIALAQLNRGVDQREGHKPRISDLRESGSLEADADVVILLHREGYYKPGDTTVAGHAEAIVAKNRNGPTGSVELKWTAEHLRFDEPGEARPSRQPVAAPTPVERQGDLRMASEPVED